MKLRFLKRLNKTLTRVWRRLDDPIPALPLDLFRVGAGLLGVVYFWHLRRDVLVYSSETGVIDHQLVRKMYPYTRLSFYQQGTPDSVFRAVNTAAMVASLGVALGVKVRPNATFLYLTAVSTYRWNLPAMYVDDVVMHLVYFWLMLLPTGRTLTVGESADWRTATVPSFTTRLFAANLAMLYFVAGLWKWDSPLWRQGIALYATLRMPISRAPSWWLPSWQPLLRPCSYFAMVVEPALALLPYLPAHSRFKYALGVSQFAFHAGIATTLKIPYANIACIAGLPIFFQEEVMDWLGAGQEKEWIPAFAGMTGGKAGMTGVGDDETPILNKALAATCVTLLALQNIWRIRERKPLGIDYHPLVARLRQRFGLRSRLNHHSNPWTAPLYMLGLVQSYRLFDWVDLRNWHQFYDGEEVTSAEIRPFDTFQLFPHTIRNVLLHSYIHDQCWILPPDDDLPIFQRSLLTRYVQQFAKKWPNTGDITIYINMSRITRENLDLREGTRRKLLQFCVRDGEPTITFMEPAC